MIENNMGRRRRELKRARRQGVAPSSSLRRHFFALGRQIRNWSETHPRSQGGRKRAIGVTSLAVGAGKSTVSFNLACSLGALSRSQILLVEADFGNHSLSRRLGHGRSPGLSEMLLGVATIEESVFPSPISDVSVMGCGRKSDQEALELPFDLLEPLMSEQLSDFGYLIFDLPLANDLTACHSVAPYLDGVVLTVESGQIDRRQVSRFRNQLESQGVEIIGVILNKA